MRYLAYTPSSMRGSTTLTLRTTRSDGSVVSELVHTDTSWRSSVAIDDNVDGLFDGHVRGAWSSLRHLTQNVADMAPDSDTLAVLTPCGFERALSYDWSVSPRDIIVIRDRSSWGRWFEWATNAAQAFASVLSVPHAFRTYDELVEAWRLRLSFTSTPFATVEAWCNDVRDAADTVYCYDSSRAMLDCDPMWWHDDEPYHFDTFDSDGVVICDECGGAIRTGQGQHPYHGGGEVRHYGCRETYSCGYCGNEFHDEDDAIDCCSSGGIQSYSYKPTPVFIGTVKPSGVRKRLPGLYLGLELEVECPDDADYSPTDVAQVVANYNRGSFYCKQDGSLDNGVEIVSHPMLLGEFARSGLSVIVDDLRSNGVLAWNAPTAGMHIHMSRDAFEPAHAYKFMRFIFGNRVPLQTLAGRRSRQWASFDIGDHHDHARCYGLKGNAGGVRYLAVNSNNCHTLELRFWRPSLKYATIQSALEFCEAAHAYTRSALSVVDAHDGNVSFERFYEWLNEDDAYPTLRARIAERVYGDTDD